ncbi:hypothetical protein AA0472_3005 [Acetobacter estunensis NRIC 0472]|nr:hypothetical protein AA0472_3005 [Acetobacter estunensis NRIC 0472]
MASLSIPGKARRAPWEAAQSAILVTAHPPQTSHHTRERLYGHPVASDGYAATRELLNDRLNTGAS